MHRRKGALLGCLGSALLSPALKFSSGIERIDMCPGKQLRMLSQFRVEEVLFVYSLMPLIIEDPFLFQDERERENMIQISW